MRMNDPLWPVVRESARRVLRLEKIKIKIPGKFEEDYKLLCDEISKHIPSRLVFPKSEFYDDPSIVISLEDNEQDLFGNIVVIGMIEPEDHVCWIESPVDEGWRLLIEACFELLLAGYPGCIGCGGPNSEKKWKEKSFRKKRRRNK